MISVAGTVCCVLACCACRCSYTHRVPTSLFQPVHHGLKLRRGDGLKGKTDNKPYPTVPICRTPMYVTTPCYIQTFEHCGQAEVSEMGMCETNNACSDTTTVDGTTRQEHMLCARDELIT